jgi:mono/diheme cytochrome c family protein
LSPDLRAAACLALLLPLAAGCRHDMQSQNKIKPLRASKFFADGASARPLPANTVARGELRSDPALFTGLRGQRPVDELPFPATREVLLRGEERFDAFCSPCHGRIGDGRGMIVTRGYKQPASFHEARLRGAPVGHFFNVMTEGYGVMPSYAGQVPVADRWAIAAYIRALQYSQNARLAELPPETQKAVAAELAKPPPPQGGAAPGAPAAPGAKAAPGPSAAPSPAGAPGTAVPPAGPPSPPSVPRNRP